MRDPDRPQGSQKNQNRSNNDEQPDRCFLAKISLIDGFICLLKTKLNKQGLRIVLARKYLPMCPAGLAPRRNQHSQQQVESNPNKNKKGQALPQNVERRHDRIIALETLGLTPVLHAKREPCANQRD